MSLSELEFSMLEITYGPVRLAWSSTWSDSQQEGCDTQAVWSLSGCYNP